MLKNTEVATPKQCLDKAQALLEEADQLTIEGGKANALKAAAWVKLATARIAEGNSQYRGAVNRGEFGPS